MGALSELWNILVANGAEDAVQYCGERDFMAVQAY